MQPMAAFSRTISPTAISPTYRLGLVLVAAAMLLLPLVYVALIAMAVWAVVWHVTANTWILAGESSSQWRLLLYLTPAVAGSVLVFFMVKPILARRIRSSDPLEVAADEQPELFALIESICRQVRAPMPTRVYVDCQVNASASFAGSGLGLLRRDLVLTIGLPLAAGLSVRELAGVLAHEFGHFAQGGGMRLTSLVRGINFWLTRVVHERDEWDEKLEAWSRQGDWRIILPLLLARFSVWLSRRILAALTWAGHAISCFMLRQMEFDADSYEVKIAGAEAFSRTTVRMRELSIGSQIAYQHAQRSFSAQTLPCDLPFLFAEHSRQLPDGLSDVLRQITESRTGIFDTHPSDADRVAAAHAIGGEGVLVGGDESATSVFRGFDSLAGSVTRHHYEQVLGLTLDGVTLASTTDTLRTVGERQRSEKAAHEFFDGRASASRPIRVRCEELEPLDFDALRATLAEAREAMASGPPAETYRSLDELASRREKAFAAEQMFVGGMSTVNAEEFSIAEPTLACAESTQAWVLEQQEALRPACEAYETAVSRRLACGIVLAARLDPSRDASALARALDALAAALPLVADARRAFVAACALHAAAQRPGASPHLGARIQGLLAMHDGYRDRIHDALKPLPVLLAADAEPAAVCAGLLAPESELSPDEFLVRVLDLYWTLLFRIVVIATDAEQALATREVVGGRR